MAKTMYQAVDGSFHEFKKDAQRIDRIEAYKKELTVLVDKCLKSALVDTVNCFIENRICFENTIKGLNRELDSLEKDQKK